MVAEWRTGKQAPEGSLEERLDMKCLPSFSYFSFWRSWQWLGIKEFILITAWR